MKLEKFFEKISLKNFNFNVKLADSNKDLAEDEFISDIINLIEKNNLEEDTIEKLSQIHKNRYEITFIKLCYYFNEFKSSKRDSKLRNHGFSFRDKILNEINMSNEKLKNNEYLVENKNNTNLFIFKPHNLLKLW